MFYSEQSPFEQQHCQRQCHSQSLSIKFCFLFFTNAGTLLHPAECRVRGTVRFSDAWAGGFATFARCQATNSIYACGLNNYGQLGLKSPVTRVNVAAAATAATLSVQNGTLEEDDEDDTPEGHDEEDMEVDESVDAALVITDQHEADKSEAALIARQGPLIQFMLTRARAFDPARGWHQFAISMHHTVALDSQGEFRYDAIFNDHTCIIRFERVDKTYKVLSLNDAVVVHPIGLFTQSMVALVLRTFIPNRYFPHCIPQSQIYGSRSHVLPDAAWHPITP